MRHLRLLIIALATVCVLTLGASAFVNTPPRPPVAGDDEIIIKGGSLTIECKDGCQDKLEAKSDGTFGHKMNGQKGDTRKIVKIVVNDESGIPLATFDKKRFFPNGKPSVVITYRTPRPEEY